MTTTYKLRVKDTAGALVAELSDFTQLAYTKKINAPGLLKFAIGGDHGLVSTIGHKYQVEVWRRNKALGLDWYCDFYGLFMAQRRTFTDRKIFLVRCPGQMIMLSWRHVMWTTDYADRAKFTSDRAETIMKTLVDYNACANATTGNGRERDGAITGVSIQADGANGSIIDWACAWKNLLVELQALARVAGGDFDLIKTGGATWQFRWYTGQRGTDRSATVIFAPGHGNMARPTYVFDRVNEKTVAVTAGQGQAGLRMIEVRTGADYGAANDIEMFVDARIFSTQSGLQAEGDRRLDEAQARQELSFSVLQTPSTFYGKHYCVGGVLGDLVTARYDDIEQTKKIVGVTVVRYKDGSEGIDVETETQ